MFYCFPAIYQCIIDEIDEDNLKLSNFNLINKKLGKLNIFINDWVCNYEYSNSSSELILFSKQSILYIIINEFDYDSTDAHPRNKEVKNGCEIMIDHHYQSNQKNACK